MRISGGSRQVVTYAVMRQAVKAVAIRLGVDPTKFSLHSVEHVRYLWGDGNLPQRVYPIKW